MLFTVIIILTEFARTHSFIILFRWQDGRWSPTGSWCSSEGQERAGPEVGLGVKLYEFQIMYVILRKIVYSLYIMFVTDVVNRLCM